MFLMSEAAAAINAELIGRDVRVEHVLTDTRTMRPGSLFVALRGERHDGHEFVAAALDKGAVAAVVASHADRARWSGATLLSVPDTTRALGVIAAWWRQRHAVQVVAVIGSNGKTTTKEMIASILRTEYGADRVLATPGNWNNEIGLPLTVLMLRSQHRAAVLEIGMNHRGETALLAGIASPHVGLINNAQREHQLFMQSVQDVAEEHGTLIEALPANGVVVLNADDPFVGYWRERAGQLCTREFSLGHPAAVSGSQDADARGVILQIRIDQQEPLHTRLNILGEHSARNALAAAAVADALGVSRRAIAEGLGAFEPAKGRLQLKRGSRGALVIDDSYNANPDSMRAAIDVLAAMAGNKILIIGDMDEVGISSPQVHAEIGRYACEHGIHRLLAIGAASKHSVQAFGAAAQHFDAVEQLVDAAVALARENTAMLVKGSRFMRMESVVDCLVTEA